jgi:hypothetical protein
MIAKVHQQCPSVIEGLAIQFEWEHLKKKLEIRDPHQLSRIRDIPVAAHPLFSIVSGTMEEWERA